MKITILQTAHRGEEDSLICKANNAVDKLCGIVYIQCLVVFYISNLTILMIFPMIERVVAVIHLENISQIFYNHTF